MNRRLEGSLFGIAGGIVGMLAMKQAIRWLERVTREREDAHRPQGSISLVGVQHREHEGATAAAARIVYTRLTGREPDEATRDRLSQVLHWGYGLLMAAGYGAVRGDRPGSDLLGGLAFGAALWALADELAVPLLGLGASPRSYSPRVHAQWLAGNLAYGAATAAASHALGRSRKRGLPN